MKLPNPFEPGGDYYAVLGVPKDADDQRIKRAFRRRLKQAEDPREKDRVNFASGALRKSESRAQADLVSFWEERSYEEVLARYEEQAVTLSLSEDWEVRRAFTELTERDALASMSAPPSPSASWAAVEKYAKLPARSAKLGEMDK